MIVGRARYEYKIKAIPMAEFTALEGMMNEWGMAGWNVFHIHEANIDRVPSVLIFKSRKLIPGGKHG